MIEFIETIPLFLFLIGCLQILYAYLRTKVFKLRPSKNLYYLIALMFLASLVGQKIMSWRATVEMKNNLQKYEKIVNDMSVLDISKNIDRYEQLAKEFKNTAVILEAVNEMDANIQAVKLKLDQVNNLVRKHIKKKEAQNN